MADLELNSDLDVFIDKGGDIAFATGRAAFEQEIALALIDYYHEHSIGENDPQTALESIQVGARRAVGSVGLLDRLASVQAGFVDGTPNKIKADILFDTGEVLTFESEGDSEPTLVGAQVYEDGVFESSTSFDVYEDGVMQ